MNESPPDAGKTMLRRIEQYRDRWSSYGMTTGIVAISDKPSVDELRRHDLFADYDDKFLERISPDVSIALWRGGSVLFEQGAYLDLAFYIAEGDVEVTLEGIGQTSDAKPIFDVSRTLIVSSEELEKKLEKTVLQPAPEARQPAEATRRLTLADAGSEISFLSTMDYDLPVGAVARLGKGEIFGEIGAMSGWPMSVTAKTASDCQLVQIRVPALRLMKRKSSQLKERLDRLYRDRALFTQLKSTPLLAGCDERFLTELGHAGELVSCEPGEVITREGEVADALYLVRSGFVRLAQRFGADDLVATYLSKGMTLGETELLVDEIGRWEHTATAVEYLELVRIGADRFRELLERYPEIEDSLWQSAIVRLKESGSSKRHIERSGFLQLSLDRGLVQGNSMLLIDLETCTRCDDCVRACAATHDGRPRFVREGDRVGNMLVAKSCYHCRDPVCLVGCPTGAIHRAGVGDVVAITDDICIGCATCANNCPYDAIMMHDTGTEWPDDMVPVGLRGQPRQVASKCDLCHDTGHDPACVSNCPQGCAIRVGSVEELERVLEEEGKP